MKKLLIAVTIMALLFVGTVASESDAEYEYGTVRFFIDGEFITSTDTDTCAEVAERIDTYREGYVFIGWTDDPSTNRIVDITNLPPWDVNLYAVYEPESEPSPDYTKYLVTSAMFLFLLILAVIYVKKLS